MEQQTHAEEIGRQSAPELEEAADEYEAALGDAEKSKGESWIDLNGDL
ncbi:MAG: hypothetical protein L0227_14885 [Chloroflexi bacterium]|nr:hypothetical protein [Chloroflexota bacterium]